MLIRQTNHDTFRRQWLRILAGRKRRIGYVIAVILSLAILTGGSIWYGVRLEVSGHANAYFERWQYIKQAARQPRQTMINYWLGLSARPEQLALDFTFNDWQRLAAKQQEAVLSGSLYESDNPWVKGWINHDGKKIRIKAKLKGGPEHFNGDKWSFRIDVDDKNEAVLGMQSFSLQHPKTRFYLSEWIFHKMLSREGIIALKYMFVDVSINGRDLGIYALEEHFAAQLAERNQRRAGPILVISEELYNFNYWPQAVWRNEARRVEPYQSDKYTDDLVLAEQLETARTLVELFRRGELKTCDVFTCDLLARYFAILDVLGAEHAASGGNFKMYYNPLLAKLEPVGFDAEAEYGAHALFINEWQNYKNAKDSVNWFRSIFGDERFMELFLAELNRLTQPGYLESFNASIDGERQQMLSIVHKEFPNYNYDWDAVLEQRRVIRKILSANHLVDSYVVDNKNNVITIEAGNVMSVPVVVTGFVVDDETINLAKSVMLPPLAPNSPAVFQPFRINVPASANKPNAAIKIQYNLLGLTDNRLDAVSPWRRLINDFIEQQALFLPANFRDFSFVQVDESNKILFIKKGYWEFSRTLVVPAPYVLIIEAGTTLDLRRGASLVSYGPVQLQGQLNDPIRFLTGDDSGGGVAILRANATSYWRHARFDGLRPPDMRGWRPTGAVMFYESPVEMESVEMRRNAGGDDLLNIVRTEFHLRDVALAEAPADALDVDFGQGEITRTMVSRTGNDAFDFSGSNVVLREVKIQQAGDKGVSAGEESKIQVYDSAISQGAIGLASKDSSRLEAWRSNLTGLSAGVVLYQKKPEFGPAQARLHETYITADRDYLVEENSVLYRDDVLISGREKLVLKQVEELVARHAAQ